MFSFISYYYIYLISFGKLNMISEGSLINIYANKRIVVSFIVNVI